jgi:RNA polymerase sigma-70 factor (ECF subfamily)
MFVAAGARAGDRRLDRGDDNGRDFLRVFRHRESFQAGRSFRAWLDRICVNVCLTHREETRRRDALVSLVADEPPAAAARSASDGGRSDPENRAGAADLARSLGRILMTLPAPYRAALVLRAFGGLSYQEIAETLQCSIGTVMSRLNRARLRVQGQLADEDPW